MAGPMTHMLVSQAASDLKVIKALDPRLKNLLIRHQRFLLMGSVGPDLPAVLDALTSDHVSDRMHDGNLPVRVPTNTTARELYRTLKAAGSIGPELAFLLGYVSHSVVDVFVHPIVNAIVDGNSMEHRHCETCQDSLLFHDYMGQNIKANDYLSWLAACQQEPDELAAVLNAWQPIVDRCYGHHSCQTWFAKYTTAFSLSRQLVYYAGWSYPAPSQISASDVQRFYSQVPLPVLDTAGHFKRDVFQRAVDHVLSLWQQIFLRLVDPGHNDIDDVVRDWDLNNGTHVTTGRTFDLWR